MKKRTRQRAHIHDHSLQRRHREMQARALNLMYQLTQALGPPTAGGEGHNETGWELIARLEEAIIGAIGQLARIVDPDALLQEQAERTVQRLLPQGSRPNESGGQEWRRERVYGKSGLLATLQNMMRTLEEQNECERCVCRAIGSGALCLFCTTEAILEEGRRWIALLGPGERTLGQAPLQREWEGLWSCDTHEFLRVLSLIPAIALELGRDVRYQGEQQARAQLYELIPNVLIRAGYRRTLLHDDADVFLSPYAGFWLLRGYAQPSVTDDTRMMRCIEYRVLHDESPALNWGTTLPLPEYMALFPTTLVDILGDRAFEELQWKVGGVRYSVALVDRSPDPLHPTDSSEHSSQS